MYVFIFGPQRTGSTLLHRLLEAHPEIDSTPNDLNLLDVYSSGIPDTPKWGQWGFDDKVVKSLMQRKPHVFLGNVIDKYFKGTCNDIKLHKTCKGEFHLQAYRQAFGERAKYIFILRNPVAIMASQKYWEQPSRVNEWVDLTSKNLTFTDVYRSFRYVNYRLGQVFRSIGIIDQAVGSNEMLAIVSYEQLVNNPDRVLGDLCLKLGLKFKGFSFTDESCRKPIDPYTSHKELKGRSGIYTTAIDIWKEKLTKFETQLLYNEMVKLRKKGFKSKLVSSLFSTYIYVVGRVVDDNQDEKGGVYGGRR